MGGSGGGAFGPTQYGQPSTNMVTPATYQNVNQSPLMNQGAAQTNASIGNQQRQNSAGANAAGAGGGAGAAATNRDIAAAGQGANATAYDQAAVSNTGMENQFNQNAQRLGQSQYATEAGLVNAQNAQRQAQVAQLPGGQFFNLFSGGSGV